MINEASGEVELKSRFDDTMYVFAFGPNQIASVEDAVKKDISDLFNEMVSGRVSARVLRTIVRLTHLGSKSSKPLTELQAGDVLNAVGSTPFAKALVQGLKWMTVEAESAENPTEASGVASA